MGISAVSERKGRANKACLCRVCKQVFYASRYDAKTCGVRCRVAYHRALIAEQEFAMVEQNRVTEQQLRLERLFS